MENEEIKQLVDIVKQIFSEQSEDFDKTEICRIIETTDDGLLTIALFSDENTKITKIPNETPYDFQNGDIGLLYKVGNRINNSFVIAKFNLTQMDLYNKGKGSEVSQIIYNVQSTGGGGGGGTIDLSNYYTKTETDAKLDNKLDKVSKKYRVYATDSNGNQTDVLYWPGSSLNGYVDESGHAYTSSDPSANTIVQRDEGGHVKTWNPESNSHAVNLGYLRNNYMPYRGNSGQTNAIEVIPPNSSGPGSVFTIPSSPSVFAGGIVQRDQTDGQIFVPRTPTTDLSAVSRIYTENYLVQKNEPTVGPSNDSIPRRDASGYIQNKQKLVVCENGTTTNCGQPSSDVLYDVTVSGQKIITYMSFINMNKSCDVLDVNILARLNIPSYSSSTAWSQLTLQVPSTASFGPASGVNFVYDANSPVHINMVSVTHPSTTSPININIQFKSPINGNYLIHIRVQKDIIFLDLPKSDNDLSNYYTKTETDTKLDSYATKTYVDSHIVTNYQTIEVSDETTTYDIEFLSGTISVSADTSGTHTEKYKLEIAENLIQKSGQIDLKILLYDTDRVNSVEIDNIFGGVMSFFVAEVGDERVINSISQSGNLLSISANHNFGSIIVHIVGEIYFEDQDNKGILCNVTVKPFAIGSSGSTWRKVSFVTNM